jgi:hypothetical protein
LLLRLGDSHALLLTLHRHPQTIAAIEKLSL